MYVFTDYVTKERNKNFKVQNRQQYYRAGGNDSGAVMPVNRGVLGSRESLDRVNRRHTGEQAFHGGSGGRECLSTETQVKLRP